jgi:hypothetical protein
VSGSILELFYDIVNLRKKRMVAASYNLTGDLEGNPWQRDLRKDLPITVHSRGSILE